MSRCQARGFELRQLWHILTKADVILVGALSAWAFGLLALPAERAGVSDELVVESPVQGASRYPLSAARTIQISGAIGVAEIEIADFQVRVVHAPCRNKVCVNSGWIRASGQVIVCIPNHLILRLQGAGRSLSEIDAISR